MKDLDRTEISDAHIRAGTGWPQFDWLKIQERNKLIEKGHLFRSCPPG